MNLSYKKPKSCTMEPNKKLDDLIIILKPKIIRFTGKKFPTELWNNSFQIKKNKKISK